MIVHATSWTERNVTLTWAQVVESLTAMTHLSKSKSKCFPAPMVQWAAPISVSVAPGHTSASAVKATAGAGPLVAPRV